MIHELKILPEYFKAVAGGVKTFELRKNDRNYKVGDTLLLREWNPIETNIITNLSFTGNKVRAKITYILNGGSYGLDKDYCILGIKKL